MLRTATSHGLTFFLLIALALIANLAEAGWKFSYPTAGAGERTLLLECVSPSAHTILNLVPRHLEVSEFGYIQKSVLVLEFRLPGSYDAEKRTIYLPESADCSVLIQ